MMIPGKDPDITSQPNTCSQSRKVATEKVISGFLPAPVWCGVARRHPQTNMQAQDAWNVDSVSGHTPSCKEPAAALGERQTSLFPLGLHFSHGV